MNDQVDPSIAAFESFFAPLLNVPYKDVTVQQLSDTVSTTTVAHLTACSGTVALVKESYNLFIIVCRVLRELFPAKFATIYNFKPLSDPTLQIRTDAPLLEVYVARVEQRRASARLLELCSKYVGTEIEITYDVRKLVADEATYYGELYYLTTNTVRTDELTKVVRKALDDLAIISNGPCGP